ncbi:hypothetical protein ZHAS_00019529 [Anopheles sinensis]|uniref:Uncharacterized protein n=1 Tax=Anopheles sinensis TaxID=74873 RepID=A0A084WMN0_ANOSI|nr:hypothetical protein ZHAS_00019529 [Anopheles sinensis]
MKLTVSLATSVALVCLWMSCINANLLPMYGARSGSQENCHTLPPLPYPTVYPAPKSYVARAEKARVGIYPASKCAEKENYSGESSEERYKAVDHYEQVRQCYDSHGRLLPVSICVQLPPEAPLKLSKHLLHQIVNSLMDKPTENESPKYVSGHRKPCEYPRKPCACAKKPMEYSGESKDVYTPPKPHYEPPKKVYEPTPKPCDKVKETYETTMKPYVPKSSCEVHKPVYSSSESYEVPHKPYSPPKRPCHEPKKPYTPPKDNYTPPQEHYPTPAKPYTPPTKAYNHPQDSYPHVPYNTHKEPCSATEPPRYYTTTHVPYTTAAPSYTHPTTHRPTPYHPTATFATYTPRYPSMSYNAPNYPKLNYEPKPGYHEPAPTAPSSYPKPPKKSCGCEESHRPYYNTSY